jgi:hypothetical protein
MVGDHYNDIFKPKPWYDPVKSWPLPEGARLTEFVTKEEFAELKRQVEEMKALLIRAKEYDERNNEPNCEIEDKVALLKKVAALVGVSLEDVFGK